MSSKKTDVSQHERHHSHHSHMTFGRAFRNGAIYFLGLILCLFLFALTIVLVVRSVLSNKYTVSRLPKTYYSRLYTDIKDSLSDYTIPTGLDVSVLDGVVSEEQVGIDLNSCIRNSHPGNGYTLDTSVLEKKLNQNVINYLEGVGATVDDDTQKAVDAYVKEIGELYRKSIRLPGLDYISRISEDYDAVFYVSIIALILLAVFIVFIIIKLSRRASKALRILSYSVGGTAAMCLLGPLVALISGFYKNLNITPDYFNEFMVAYINGVLIRFLFVVLFWVVIAVVLALQARKIRKQRRRRYKASELEEDED